MIYRRIGATTNRRLNQIYGRVAGIDPILLSAARNKVRTTDERRIDGGGWTVTSRKLSPELPESGRRGNGRFARKGGDARGESSSHACARVNRTIQHDVANARKQQRRARLTVPVTRVNATPPRRGQTEYGSETADGLQTPFVSKSSVNTGTIIPRHDS